MDTAAIGQILARSLAINCCLVRGVCAVRIAFRLRLELVLVDALVAWSLSTCDSTAGPVVSPIYACRAHEKATECHCYC